MSVNEIKSKENLQSEEILSLVTNMQQAIAEPAMRNMKMRNGEEYIAHMKQRFSKLDNRYPGIFNMVITKEDQMDTRKLVWMLNLFGGMVNGDISKDDADKQVGVHLYNQFVDPHVDKDLEKNGRQE